MATEHGGWVRSGETLVHIGPPKTSTTAIQSAFAAARPQLARHGVLYPGSLTSQWNPLFDLVVRHEGGRPLSARGPSQPGDWGRLLGELRRTPHDRCVVSAECLAWATDGAIAELARDLGPARVVAGIRPLEVMLPSLWQEDVKSGLGASLDEWLHAVLVDGKTLNHRVGSPAAVDIAGLVARWAHHVGAERCAVLVVPPGRGRTSLDAFEGILGLPSATLQFTGESMVNRSLTDLEVEVIRRFNLGVGGDPSIESKGFRRVMVTHLTRTRRPHDAEMPPGLPDWALEEVRRLGRRHLEEIRDLGVLILGDADQLLRTNPHVARPARYTVDDTIDLTVDLMTGARGGYDIWRTLVENPPGVRKWVPPVLVPPLRRVRTLISDVRRRARPPLRRSRATPSEPSPVRQAT